MGMSSEEQLNDRPDRSPEQSFDIQPGETPSQWIARVKRASR